MRKLLRLSEQEGTCCKVRSVVRTIGQFCVRRTSLNWASAVITGVVLARNEERNIVDCLRALQPHVEEILLIDMESRDRTVAYARALVSKVLTHPFVEKFDAARNMAIPVASFDWLWFVDADERIPEATGRLVRQIVATRGSDTEAIAIPFKSYFCGKWIQSCGWWPGYTTARLLKRGHFRFAERVHGGVEVSGRTLQIPPDPAIGIDHFSYDSISHYLDKANRYTSSEAANFVEHDVPWSWEQATRDMMRELWHCYERNRGGLDGEHGFVLSWLSGQYRWLSRAKILERTQFHRSENSPPRVPENLDRVLEEMQAELSHLRSAEPQLPLDIVFRTPIWDPSGYAEEGRTIARVLAGGERRLLLTDIAWNDARCELRDEHVALFRALLNGRRPKYTLTITNCIPSLVVPDRLASVNILRTANETDRIPDEWLGRLLQFDEVWVLSQHCANAFRRSGVRPERIRVVPSCIDCEIYRPNGTRLTLPAALSDRFVFLSVFDWQLRKGWDVLVKAYCQEFHSSEGVGLLLKISRIHGHTIEQVRNQLNQILASIGQEIELRDDIVLWDQHLSEMEMAALYRSVDAFVLPSRGEGWGRPYMEAMASGLPTIGTGESGNTDFMNNTNSLLIPAEQVDVSEQAAAEISTFRGHKWFEPNCGALRQQMRAVQTDPNLRAELGSRARADIASHFSLDIGRIRLAEALTAAESRFAEVSLPATAEDQLTVELEGEFFAQHSFSIVNEKLAIEFLKDESIAFGARQIVHFPTSEDRSAASKQIRAALERRLSTDHKVLIRHKYPPNWEPITKNTIWVHIQPWEFGYLPEQWLKPFHEQVDEIWVPSTFVRDIYLRSGIPADKVSVVPWGIDPEVFRPDAQARLLKTEKSFRFLFVGGTIPRKGFDILLDAYLREFRAQDDVCLVVKDMGTRSFYQDATYRNQILAAQADTRNPEIVYLEEQLSEGQLASVYTACHCLVAPYRGEGFGLPILEAMACGLTPVIPHGGPSDDFASTADAFFLPAQIAKCIHPWDLCGPATELSVDAHHVGAAMRRAAQNPGMIKSMGAAGSERVRREFTWRNTVQMMRERIEALATRYSSRRTKRIQPLAGLPTAYPPSRCDPTITALVVVDRNRDALADCLARLSPYVNDILVFLTTADDRCVEIAREYGGCAIATTLPGLEAARTEAKSHVGSDWILDINAEELLAEESGPKMKDVLRSVASDISSLRCRVHNGTNGSPGVLSREVRLVRNQSRHHGAAITAAYGEGGEIDVDIAIIANG